MPEDIGTFGRLWMELWEVPGTCQVLPCGSDFSHEQALVSFMRHMQMEI